VERAGAGLGRGRVPGATLARVSDHPQGLTAPRLRIGSGRQSLLAELRELWAFRELAGFLVWRDVKVRYVQTVLGPAWAIIQPFVQMILFTVIFGRLAGIQGEYHVPYPLFVFTGLLPWMYFSTALTQTSKSMVANANLVTKVYVPRLMIPLASLAVAFVDFLLSFLVLLGLFVWFSRAPHWHTVVSPFFLGMALLASFGVGLWVSALTIRFRDIPYVIPFLTQLWLYVSPVIYGTSFIPKKWEWLIALNPMTGAIDGFRWAVLGKGLPHYDLFAVSIGVGLVLCVSGLVYFRRVERTFADVI
jgi:lipopolysaccharide transport system permease protein